MQRRLYFLLISVALAAAGCSSQSSDQGTQGDGSVAGTSKFVAVELSKVGNGQLEELQGVPTGEQSLGGVDFRLGPKYLQLGSRTNPKPAREVVGIAVGRRLSKVHFLQAAQGGGFRQAGHPKHEQEGVEIGRYVVHYENGRHETIPLIYGEHLRDWWNWDKSQPTPKAKVVWHGENPAAKKFNVPVRLFSQSWQNPHPDDAVAAIDFISAGANAAPMCLAITLEGASSTEASSKVTARVESPRSDVRSAPSSPQQDLPPDIAEERRRQAAFAEGQRLRAEWFTRVRECTTQRAKSSYPLIDELSNHLIQLALRASKSRDATAQKRLSDERNKFAEDRLALPRSPEARDAALNYADRRIAEEQRFLGELRTLASKIPSEATEEERRELSEEVAAASKVVEKLTASRKLIAALPRSAPAGEKLVEKSPSTKTTQLTDDRPSETGAKESPKQPKKDFLGPPPRHWVVTADPTNETYRFPEPLPYKALKNVSASTVLFAPGQTAFLGAAKEGVDVEAYFVYDLRSGKIIGRASGFNVRAEPGSLEGPALSANGEYLAVPNSFEKQILVDDVRKRKRVAQIKCDFFAPAVLFPAHDRLLVLDTSSTKRAVLWELPQAKEILSFELADEPALEASKAIVSPGGKFLAIVARQGGADNQVQFYDLTNGKLAGALQVAGGGPNKPRINAIAFSADGSEFAAFVFGVLNGLNAAEAMVVWDLATGRPVYQKFIEDGRKGGQGLGMLSAANRSEPLQWFPDGQGWLLSQRYIVDREAAAVVQIVEAPGEGLYSAYGTKIVDDKRILVADLDQSFRVVEVRRKPEK